MELSEAIDVLKNKIGDYVIAEYCNNCWHKKDCTDDCNYLLSIYTVLQALEELQKENEKLKEIDLITVHIKGVCDEKERWRNKINDKILEWQILEGQGRGSCQSITNVLKELLKGE